MTRRLVRTSLTLVVVIVLLAVARVALAAPVLKPGARGTAVQSLQKNLSALGFPVPPTGYFGTQTKQAVVGFQKSVGLKADGIVGPGTWAALDRRLAAKTAIAQGIYIVQRADTITSIAATLKMRPEDLAAANSMSVGHPLYIGQALTVPSAADLAKLRAPAGAPADDLPALISQGQQVSLTFDDDPGAAYLGQILDTLAQHGARATFFVTEDTVLSHSSLLARAAASGHHVENHGMALTQAHDSQAIIQGIQRCGIAIERLTGRKPQFYRPLDYSLNVDICRLSSLAGCQVVMWTNLGSPERDQLLSATKAALAPGAIIRLSLNDPMVPQILGSLLEHIEAQGYALAQLGEL